VVDDQIDGRQRVDLLRVAAEPLHRLAHHGEIHHRRHAGEILCEYPRRHEGDFFFLFGFRIPVGQRLDIDLADVMVVFLPEQVLQQDLQRNRQTGNIFEPRLFQQIEAEYVIAFTADFQNLSRAETIHILLCHYALLII